MLINNFEATVDELKQEYYYQKQRANTAYKLMQQWDRDEEIQKHKDNAEYVRNHSLLQLSDQELLDIIEFRKEHYEKCALPKHKKNFGNTYIYELTGTGLGTEIKITCPICGETKNVTDTSNW